MGVAESAREATQTPSLYKESGPQSLAVSSPTVTATTSFPDAKRQAAWGESLARETTNRTAFADRTALAVLSEGLPEEAKRHWRAMKIDRDRAHLV